jgi:transposase-like protein
VSTRRYESSLETKEIDIPSKGTSKSSVSRRFVAMTTKKLVEWRKPPLRRVRFYCALYRWSRTWRTYLIVPLGIDKEGKKHVLGAWEGATENLHVTQVLLDNLVERGLKIDPSSVLFVIDGSKAPQ